MGNLAPYRRSTKIYLVTCLPFPRLRFVLLLAITSMEKSCNLLYLFVLHFASPSGSQAPRKIKSPSMESFLDGVRTIDLYESPQSVRHHQSDQTGTPSLNATFSPSRSSVLEHQHGIPSQSRATSELSTSNANHGSLSVFTQSSSACSSCMVGLVRCPKRVRRSQMQITSTSPARAALGNACM